MGEEVKVNVIKKTAAKADQSMPKNYGRKKAVALITLALLVLAVGGVSALYIGAANTQSDKDVEIVSLKDQVNQLQIANKSADAAPESSSAAAATPSPAASTPSCMGGSEYTATLGKFTATLSDPYVITRALDAPFEGPGVTDLSILECLSGEKNVAANTPVDYVKVLAHPVSPSTDLKTSFESRNGSLTANGTVVIAGVTAQKYSLAGLVSVDVVYFDNNGVGYQIESGTGTLSQTMFADLIADWVFTP